MLPESGATYVLGITLFETCFFLALVLWVVVDRYGKPDPGFEDSQLPVISSGFANNPAFQGTFIAGICISTFFRFVFWRNFDATPRGPVWWTRAALAVTLRISLIVLASLSFKIFPVAHSVVAGVGIGLFIGYEVLSIAQRAYIRRRQCTSLVVFGLTTETGCLIVLPVALGCFVSKACVGGGSAGPIFEYVYYLFFPLTTVFFLLDLRVEGPGYAQLDKADEEDGPWARQ